ncbi:phage portal protein [Atopobiaceae bacterium 24-176]
MTLSLMATGLPDPSAKAPVLEDGAATADELAMLQRCWTLWHSKLERNALRTRYYRGHVSAVTLPGTVPPEYRTLDTVVGWPARAVESLAARSVLNGFSTASGDGELDRILAENDFGLLYEEAKVSELVHSCSFWTVSAGDPSKGDPSVVVNAYSALNATAVWDSRRKRVAYGMAIVDADEDGDPSEVNLYTPDTVVTFSRTAGRRTWTVRRERHSMGRPLIEPMVHRPSIERPMGTSRITRAVMALTDSAMRTELEAEVSSALYSAPKRYLVGVDPADFEGGWDGYIDAIMTVARGVDDSNPQVGQFMPTSPAPFSERMRDLAARFAGETGVPMGSLGVVHDNPASADAIAAAREDLVVEAEALNRTNGRALRNVALMALATARGTPVSALGDELTALRALWGPADKPSRAALADAGLKYVQAFPALAETSVGMELAGLSEDQIERARAETVNDQALGFAAALLAPSEAGTETGSQPQEE